MATSPAATAAPDETDETAAGGDTGDQDEGQEASGATDLVIRVAADGSLTVFQEPADEGEEGGEGAEGEQGGAASAGGPETQPGAGEGEGEENARPVGSIGEALKAVLDMYREIAQPEAQSQFAAGYSGRGAPSASSKPMKAMPPGGAGM